MPELPEVRVVSRKLNSEISNEKINKVVVRLPKLIKNQSEAMFIKRLENRKFKKVYNLGKFIVFELEDNLLMLNHLRMEGKWRVEDKLSLSKNDHIIFHLNKKYLVFSDTRQFATFHLYYTDQLLRESPAAKLAQEPQKTDVDWLLKKLSRKTIAIKSALLDQTILVGLGNIYVNEVLWDVKIHPETKSNSLSKKQLQKILDSSAKIMNKSTEMGGTTIHSFKSFNEVEGNYQNELKVHGREGLRCFRCKKPIKKIRVGGRGTYYCDFCQKWLIQIGGLIS